MQGNENLGMKIQKESIEVKSNKKKSLKRVEVITVLKKKNIKSEIKKLNNFYHKKIYKAK